MSEATVAIAPRRSMALFAVLSILMVLASYVFAVALAILCVFLPYLGLTATRSVHLQLVALLLGGIVVACTILWSILPRPDKFEPPGLLLERAAHPKLFSELDGISSSLGETLPREVYLIGGANAFVADRGGLLGFGSRRVMGIGLPLLSTLTLSEFRAVLAHEFAHFYGGDTRLGPWVYRSQSAMIRIFENMGKIEVFQRVGIIQLLHAAVSKILEWYFLFFLKVINFISRKQEYRADELACLIAGARPMMEGLRKIHAAGLAWPAYWVSEVWPVVGKGCLPAIGDGFLQFLAAPPIAEQLQRAVQNEIAEGKTNPFDTHPPLRDRISAIGKLPDISHNCEFKPASDLFESPGKLEREFLENRNPRLAEKPLRKVKWDQVGELVMIPSWKKVAEEHLGFLRQFTVGTLPAALNRLEELASRIHNPQGMLLSGEQRAESALQVIECGVNLSLVENGWKLVSQPGIFHFCRGEERIQTHQVVGDLIPGKMSGEEWRERCERLGIAELRLAPEVEVVTEAKTT
jgi:heat shock protein HtpX